MDIIEINNIYQIPVDIEIAIYGAASTGKTIYRMLKEKGYMVSFFIDDDINKWGSNIEGINIISFERFMELYSNKRVAIILGSIYTRIIQGKIEKANMRKDGFVIFDLKKVYDNCRGSNNRRFVSFHNKKFYDETINSLFSIFQDDISHSIINKLDWVYKHQYLENDIYSDICCDEEQYFTKDVLTSLPKEKLGIIDGGAYHGELLSDIARHGIELERAFIFEPDAENFTILNDSVEKSKNRDRCIVFNKGLWSKSGSLFMDGVDDQCRVVEYKTDREVFVTSIDECIDTGIHFIKMDIEGAELEALKGARETLLNCRPVLAISVYHSPEDFVGIPIFLSGLLDDYRWRLLHHTNEFVETTLYGVPN